MAFFIQRKGNGHLETVCECKTKQEAQKMLSEYRMSEPRASYYISTRCCGNWHF